MSQISSDAPVYDVSSVHKLLYDYHSEDVVLKFGLPPAALPGFLTFFDPGWGILLLRDLCKDKGHIFSSQDWYDCEMFAKTTENPRYRQIRLEAVEGSFDKSFDEQQRLLPPSEEVPSARVVCMGTAIHFLLSGQWLFEEYAVRCADKASDGSCVVVGNPDGEGLFLHNNLHGDRGYARFGLASSRKI